MDYLIGAGIGLLIGWSLGKSSANAKTREELTDLAWDVGFVETEAEHADISPQEMRLFLAVAEAQKNGEPHKIDELIKQRNRIARARMSRERRESAGELGNFPEAKACLLERAKAYDPEGFAQWEQKRAELDRQVLEREKADTSE